MTQEILDRMESILREEGFTHLSIRSSSHSWTLSGDKAALKAVVHLTEREELPYHSAANEKVSEPADLRMKASLVRPEMGKAIQAGGGESPAATEQPPQRGRSRQR
jgi:hypothetical protein